MNPNYHATNPVYPGSTYFYNPANTHVYYIPENVTTTTGETHKWDNKYHRKIPVITFDPTCKKCHGTGTKMSTFSKTPLPCPSCYVRHGYCKKCYGNGMNFRKDKPCNKCDKGRRIKKANDKLTSSSSDSDQPNYKKH